MAVSAGIKGLDGRARAKEAVSASAKRSRVHFADWPLLPLCSGRRRACSRHTLEGNVLLYVLWYVVVFSEIYRGRMDGWMDGYWNVCNDDFNRGP